MPNGLPVYKKPKKFSFSYFINRIEPRAHQVKANYYPKTEKNATLVKGKIIIRNVKSGITTTMRYALSTICTITDYVSCLLQKSYSLIE